MNQNELNRAVAQVTGESVSIIRGMGFVPLTPVPVEREPLAIDWDELEEKGGAENPARPVDELLAV